jgi:hypothetical protein
MKVALCTGSSSTDLVLMNKLTVYKCLAGDYCDYRCISIIVSCVVAELFSSCWGTKLATYLLPCPAWGSVYLGVTVMCLELSVAC